MGGEQEGEWEGGGGGGEEYGCCCDGGGEDRFEGSEGGVSGSCFILSSPLRKRGLMI